MKAIYFKSEHQDLTILISFYYSEKENQVIIDEIAMLPDEKKAVGYLERKQFELFEDNDSKESKVINNLKVLLEGYLSGEKINLFRKLGDIRINLDLKSKFPTDFSQKVVEILLKLEYGQTISYSDIGRKINSKAFRAIGNVLKRNPLPLIIPCHRIIRKDGKVGGFMGINEDQAWETNLKKNLLKMERFNKN